MVNLRQRIERLERVRKTGAPDHIRTVHANGFTLLCRAGKAIIALPENGRDAHA